MPHGIHTRGSPYGLHTVDSDSDSDNQPLNLQKNPKSASSAIQTIAPTADP